jgi:putative component of membrane protein insertase Oxa1/YidC/SpoIIIJ protein YidD
MRILFLFGIVLLNHVELIGQTFNDSIYLKKIIKYNAEQTNYDEYLNNDASEANQLISFSFYFYKKYISSQDVDACVFYPSCSVYTIRAVEKKGVFKGLLEGFDRLMRCNSFVNQKDYEYNKFTKKYYDLP